MKSHIRDKKHYAEEQWADKHGFAYDETTNSFHQVIKHRRNGGCVPSLDDVKGDVKVEYFPANELLTVSAVQSRWKNKYGAETPKCKTAEKLCNVLISADEKKSVKSRKTSVELKEYSIVPDEEETTRSVEYPPLLESVCTEKRILKKDDNGKRISVSVETEEENTCKDYKSARENHRHQKKQFLATCNYKNVLFMTLTAPNNTFSDKIIKKYVSDLLKTLKNKKYKDVMTYCLAAIEPSEENGWHAHIMPYFPNGIPDDFVKAVEKLWVKKFKDIEIKTTKYMVRFHTVQSVEHLVELLDYLNPTSNKKVHRLCYYPVRSRTMWSVGEPAEIQKAITSPTEAKKITQSEFDTLRNSYKRLVADETTFGEEEVIEYSILEYYFSINWNAIQCYLLKSQESEAEEIITLTAEEFAEEEAEQLAFEGVILKKEKEPWREINYDCYAYKPWKY